MAPGGPGCQHLVTTGGLNFVKPCNFCLEEPPQKNIIFFPRRVIRGLLFCFLILFGGVLKQTVGPRLQTHFQGGHTPAPLLQVSGLRYPANHPAGSGLGFRGGKEGGGGGAA